MHICPSVNCLLVLILTSPFRILTQVTPCLRSNCYKIPIFSFSPAVSSTDVALVSTCLFLPYPSFHLLQRLALTVCSTVTCADLDSNFSCYKVGLASLFNRYLCRLRLLISAVTNTDLAPIPSVTSNRPLIS